MDLEEFRKRGKEMIDYICQYNRNLSNYRVTPDVEPGYLRKLLPDKAPQEPEGWDKIMEDVNQAIIPGMTHWQHPGFHAYFPHGNSYPSILGELLADAFGCVGLSWAAGPACTELETIVMNWFGKAIGLPYDFISSNQGSKGGGVMQPSGSECIFVAMLAARNQAIEYLKTDNPSTIDSALLPKLVAYCSNEAHSSVEKAAKLLLVQIRILHTDCNGSLQADVLKNAIETDKANGLFPFFVSTILGSTSSCSFDNLQELGPICKEQACTWLHVDAAYAGSGFICPEFKEYLQGIEYADSFTTNPNKWLLVTFDCSCLWVKNRLSFTKGFVVNPLYLQHANEDEDVDLRHWGIPLSRRFRALKLWIVFRQYGLSGLRKHIRNHINIAKHFESLVRKDSRFEIVNARLGLVCFRLIAPDSVNQTLLASINASGKAHMVPSVTRGKYVIRMCVNANNAKQEDVEHTWSVISEHASQLLRRESIDKIVSLHLTKEQSRRHSFTKGVSKETYEHITKMPILHDFAKPILVIDNDSVSK